jgi:hypothetical protein
MVRNLNRISARRDAQAREVQLERQARASASAQPRPTDPRALTEAETQAFAALDDFCRNGGRVSIANVRVLLETVRRLAAE